MITDVYCVITTQIVPVKYGSSGLTFQKVLLEVGMADFYLLYHVDVAPRQRPPARSGHKNSFIIKTIPPVGGSPVFYGRLVRWAGIIWSLGARKSPPTQHDAVCTRTTRSNRLGVKVLFWPMTSRTCVSIHPHCWCDMLCERCEGVE